MPFFRTMDTPEKGQNLVKRLWLWLAGRQARAIDLDKMSIMWILFAWKSTLTKGIRHPGGWPRKNLSTCIISNRFWQTPIFFLSTSPMFDYLWPAPSFACTVACNPLTERECRYVNHPFCQNGGARFLKPFFWQKKGNKRQIWTKQCKQCCCFNRWVERGNHFSWGGTIYMFVWHWNRLTFSVPRVFQFGT